jgi:hypothetical protein
VLLGLIVLAACAAPWLAPNSSESTLRRSDLYAQPTRIYMGSATAWPPPHLASELCGLRQGRLERTGFGE